MTEDTRMNEILMTGSVFALLHMDPDTRVEPVVVDGVASNELYVWVPFMRSRYRLTVTLDPE